MTKIILGGGLSGLTSAYYLSKAVPQQKLILIESSNHLGGWIKSNKLEQGIIFEEGPRTIRPGGEPGINTLNLVQELNLSEDVAPIFANSPAAKNRMIYVNHQLHLLPNSLASLFKMQKPFSKPLIAYLLQDLLAKKKHVQDESIYDFTKRRFGVEVADYLISPMICGICAGNAKEVSVNFLMKQLFEWEQKYGNIWKGILKHTLFDRNKKPFLSDLALRAKNERWSVYTFKGGMETLPNALESVIKNSNNINIQTNTKCNQIEFGDNSTLVHLENRNTETCRHIVSSVPAPTLASLIKNQHPNLAKMLENIRMVTVGVVNLYYKGDLITNPGFGFLVPPKENLPILGVIFDSCFSTYKNKTVLTVMMGGFWFKEQFGDNPSADFLLKTALEQIKNILGIYEEPVQFKVNILKNCIPQYTVGHNKNVENIQNYIKALKLPLSLCGSSYYGVGINDVILSAKNTVKDSVT